MVMELKLIISQSSSSSSLPTTNISKSYSSSFLTNHFISLAQRWKLHIQRISWNGPNMFKRALVHVVKEGETLSSISKLYNVPIIDIAAANEDMVNVNLVLEGQRLSIPSTTILGCAQLCHIDRDKLHEHQKPKTTLSFGFGSGKWNQIINIPSSPRLSLAAKTTGSFLVLVPLMVFCIRCIMGALQKRTTDRPLRNRVANKSGFNHNSSPSNSVRWRTLLDESTEAESQPPDYDSLSEDQEQLHFEDTSRDYTKLEDDYQKFLTECGMSNWGYWRGGSPE